MAANGMNFFLIDRLLSTLACALVLITFWQYPKLLTLKWGKFFFRAEVGLLGLLMLLSGAMHFWHLPRGLAGENYKNPLWSDNFIQSPHSDTAFDFRWTGWVHFPSAVDDLAIESNIVTAVYLDDVLVDGPPSVLDLGSYEARRFLGAGWSYDEKNRDSNITFVWSAGVFSTLYFRVEERAEYELTMQCVPLSYPGSLPQTITVEMNGEQVGSITLQPGWDWKTYTLTLPPSVFEESIPGLVMLKFIYEYTRESTELFSDVQESRELAVAFDSVMLKKTTSGISCEGSDVAKQLLYQEGIHQIILQGRGERKRPFLRFVLDRKSQPDTTLPEDFLFPATVPKEQIQKRTVLERRVLGGIILGKMFFLCWCCGPLLAYRIRKRPVTRTRTLVWGILVFSLLLRFLLVAGGGQFFWPDEEYRYATSRQAVRYMFSEQPVPVLRHLLGTADHIGFKIMLVFPAVLEKIVGQSSKIPAMLLSLCSVINIWLLWRIALRAGAREREALLAAFLAAISATFFYYSRHLLPYDLAMTFGLLGLFVAIKRPVRVWNSLWCGILSSVTFLTYNGYWVLGVFVLLLHTFYKANSVKTIVFRSLLSAAGLLAPVGVLIGVSTLLGQDLLGSFFKFSSTVTQGEFSEGWLLPIKYFWHAEHFLLALWAGAFFLFVFHRTSGKRKLRAILWFIGILFVYGILVIFSVGLEKFVVYGRLSRQLLPFFCLLGAYILEQLWNSHAKFAKTVTAICLLAILQAGFNFHQPLIQVFPREFIKQAQNMVPLPSQEYRLLYAEHIWEPPKELALPVHKVLLSARHPLQFSPYQYEGYTREQRGSLRSTDISMRLIQIEKEQ